MVAPWMLYALVVAALVGAAAVPFERTLRRFGRGGRWAWVGALLASAAVPVGSWLAAPGAVPAGGEAPVTVGPVTLLAEGGAGGGIPLFLDRAFAVLGVVDPWLLDAWLAASAAAAALLALGAFRLRRSSGSWRRARVDGVDVLVSEEVGPAVLGLFRHRIVLPRWAVESDAEPRRWILAHEREHLAARDPALVSGALLLLVLFPWNAALWWQLWRLRLAVEVDCDARVLGGAPVGARRRYGRLLLDVGRRARTPRLAAVASFSERPGDLERRIREMATERAPRWRVLALSALGGALLAVAVAVPGPAWVPWAADEPGVDEPEISAVEVDPPLEEGVDVVTVTAAPPAAPPLEEGPNFTPFTERPQVLNRVEVQEALVREYPPLLRDAGIGGTARVHFFIEADGTLRDVRIDRSSGHRALDAAALKVARTIRFSAALNRDEPVPVWISLPITFQSR